MATTTSSTSTQSYGDMNIPLYDADANAVTAKNTMGETAEEIRGNFLKLLVAQMQNQDPLSPTDNADFTAQLAQISSLESQEQMNVKMDQLISSLSASQSYGLINTIGRYASVESDEVTLDDYGASASIEVDAGYPTVEVTIADSDGKVVATQTFTNPQTGPLDFTWDGSDLEGNTLENGTYGISAVGVGQSGTRSSLTVFAHVGIVGVTNGDSGWQVRLANGTTVPQADLQGIY